ncbi:MAG: hypothetical protein QOH71_1194 [Blastocatellia bacterium]|jgi:hypothetical protein|nr:hypothetical protein [Blastocatellia bacterium]
MLGLNIPKGMSCREFAPGIEKFCSNPSDFVSPSQIIQMATFFGFKKAELKKIKIMAEAAQTSRVAEEKNAASFNAASSV